MDYFFTLLSQIIPALLVFLLAWLFFKKQFQTVEKGLKYEKEKEQVKIITPLRLQAYERLILMLERISPSALVMRGQKSQQSSAQLQLAMMKAVREEFDHNISMQMYVSETAWTLVSKSKEEVLQIIKIAGSKVDPSTSSLELSKNMLELNEQLNDTISNRAIKELKKEVRSLYS